MMDHKKIITQVALQLLGDLLELHENQRCAQNNWEDMEEEKRKQKLLIAI
jgi:hypothetical protein